MRMKGVARPVLVLIVLLFGLVTVWAAGDTHAIPQKTRRPQNGVSTIVKPSSQRQPLKKLVLQVTPSDPAEAEWREKFETVNRIRVAFGYPALNPDGSLPKDNRKQTLIPRTDAKIVKPSKVRQVRQLKSSLQKSLTPVRSGFLEVANSAESEAADNLKTEAKVVAITFPVPNMNQLRTQCGSSMTFATGTVTTHVTGAAVNRGPHIWTHANGCTYWAEDGTRLRRILGFTGSLSIPHMKAPRPAIPDDVGKFLDAMVVPAPMDPEWLERHTSNIVQGHILADSLGGDTRDPGNFFPQTRLSNSQTGAWGKAEMIALHLQNYCEPIISSTGASEFTAAIQTAHGLNPFPSGIVEVTNVFTYASPNAGIPPTTSGMNDFIPTGGTYYVAIKVSETVANAGTGTMVTNPVECGARLRLQQFCGSELVLPRSACASNVNPNVHPNPIRGGQWERVRVFWRHCVLRNRPHSNGIAGDTENWCVWSTQWTNDATPAAGNHFNP